MTGVWLILLFVVLGLSCLFPCCVLAVAWGTCITSKRTQGRSPTGAAWAFCGVFFVISLVGGFFLPFGYYIFSLVMVIPFCLDSDVFYTAPTASNVNIVHSPGFPAVGVSHLQCVCNTLALCSARAQCAY